MTRYDGRHTLLGSAGGILEGMTISELHATEDAAPVDSPQPRFRVRPIMRQGTPASLPQTWERFASREEARQAIKAMYHDDRVLRAFIVADTVPPAFVEWVDR